MISLFQYYNIKPIFIFDGKIDKEKIETINRRKEQKFIAEENTINYCLNTTQTVSSGSNLKNSLPAYLEICLVKLKP